MSASNSERGKLWKCQQTVTGKGLVEGQKQQLRGILAFATGSQHKMLACSLSPSLSHPCSVTHSLWPSLGSIACTYLTISSILQRIHLSPESAFQESIGTTPYCAWWFQSQVSTDTHGMFHTFRYQKTALFFADEVLGQFYGLANLDWPPGLKEQCHSVMPLDPVLSWVILLCSRCPMALWDP